MRIDASNPEHQTRYAVYVDGCNISDCCAAADDIAHEALVYVRTRAGEDLRCNGKRLTAVVRGHVQLVPHVGARGAL
jgi:hypothetical protein